MIDGKEIPKEMSFGTKPLGQIATIRTGKRDANHQDPNGMYPFYTCAVGQFRSSTYDFDGPSIILPGNGANVGKTFFYDGKFEAYQRTYVVNQFDQMVHPYFLYYCFEANWADYIATKQFGSATNYIVVGDLKAFPVPLPPLPEQQRIVGILDEAFDGIATAKANAERNLLNARALFQSVFAAITDVAAHTDWLKTTVENVAQQGKGTIRTGPFGSQLLHGEFVDEGIAVLGIDNAVANEFRWGKKRFITPEKFKALARYQVRPGDVLITIMGTCGRCAIVPDDIPTAINTKHLCCITLDTRKCLPGFLHNYFLYHPEAQQFMASRAKGSIMAGLNMEIIKALPLLLPPIVEQERIVTKLNSLREETQRLESIYQQKLAALDELKKSLLHQAFTGQL